MYCEGKKPTISSGIAGVWDGSCGSTVLAKDASAIYLPHASRSSRG